MLTTITLHITSLNYVQYHGVDKTQARNQRLDKCDKICFYRHETVSPEYMNDLVVNKLRCGTDISL